MRTTAFRAQSRGIVSSVVSKKAVIEEHLYLIKLWETEMARILVGSLR